MEKPRISHLSGNCVTNLFGTLPDGREIYCYTLSNAEGMEFTVINYGATITSIKVPGNNGLVDVVLGFDDIDDYIDSFALPSAPYFGSVIGRYAGRIADATFRLDGETIQLNANNNGNTLHGGLSGFGRAYWQMKKIQGGARPSIVFSYTSKDGEENFPGNLTIEVTYELTEDNSLKIEYNATTDKATVLNLTQHSYFNLAGHTQQLDGQQLKVNADKILAVTPQGIPTGDFTAVEGTKLDFRQAEECPRDIDNSYILPQDVTYKAAELQCAATGLGMEIYTNQPSLHIYVGGNCFGQLKGKQGAAYGPYSGIAFETQNYPDAPNKPQFPTAVLKPGKTYSHETVYKFTKL